MIQSGDLRSKILIKQTSTVKDAGGSPIEVITGSYYLRAKVENRKGRNSFNNGSENWDYDYEFEVRYERSRVIQSNSIVVYDGKGMKVNSVEFDSEATPKFTILRCSAIDNYVAGAGNGHIDLGIGKITYVATEETNTFTDTRLIGKTLYIATKDGIEYEVILNSSPTGKQVLFDSTTGQLTWSVKFAITEVALLKYY